MNALGKLSSQCFRYYQVIKIKEIQQKKKKYGKSICFLRLLLATCYLYFPLKTKRQTNKQTNRQMMISRERIIVLSISLKTGAINIHFFVEWYRICISRIIHDIVYKQSNYVFIPQQVFHHDLHRYYCLTYMEL